MLQDKSEGKAATWEFLDRRLDDVLTIGQQLNTTRNFGDAVTTGLLSIVNMVGPIIGFNSRATDDTEMLRMQQELKNKK